MTALRLSAIVRPQYSLSEGGHVSSARFRTLALIVASGLVANEPTGVADGVVSGLLSIHADCVAASVPVFGQTTLADRPNGVSGSVAPLHRLRVNLNRPRPGGGGLALGVITDTSVTPEGEFGLLTEWKTVRDTVYGLLDIPVGETVPVDQLNVFFHINGRFHILQVGPQPLGHCHAATKVHGTGTSRATISRPAATRWVTDLPAGSVGRLFDVSQSVAQAVDRGTYSVELHYDLVAAALPIADALQRMARTAQAPALIARYRAIQRDSASAYTVDQRQLSAVGYWLLDRHRPAEAKLLFDLTLDEFPRSARAYAGRGEAYIGVGDTSKGISDYKRALKLNPQNQDAIDGLRRLGIKP